MSVGALTLSAALPLKSSTTRLATRSQASQRSSGCPPRVSGGSASAPGRHGASGISSEVLKTIALASGRAHVAVPPAASVAALVASVVDDCLECWGFADGAAQGFLVSTKPKLPQGRLILESLCINRKV